MKKNILVAPVLKWVGGKRQLIEDIEPLIPKKISTYVEPFVGGAAVLFHLQPKKAIINDFNSELMNVYQVIKENPNDLIDILEKHKSANSEEYYYETRALDRTSDYENLSKEERAGRILYLNKTCYNGLFRVNSSGQFNAPYGKYKNPAIVNDVTIKAVSNYFNSANLKILTGDYREALKGLRKGAFVYLDPPYMPLSSSSNFTGYTENGFGYEKQVELRDECLKLNKKGIKFLQSNSYTPEILELYSDSSVFKIKVVQAKRSINSKSDKRGDVSEVLIYNYEQE
ncbi:TPA: DNA adenine methylase [Streptococcus equi subsp. zooepidemicus]|uniref:DNA adenine methylase n=1 Tax=Streptococcus equi TaxID=1336 RepID=UPI001E3B6B0C|nr:DNA adenine methylase [Streptococcus equi]MCD3374815.1 DNA adenine methylase [Streptococcus equi subsp. zooepidemicus]MDI5952558.1 DNA adenine methylase [Streptococcus equi subsp. zooepidemicus]MDI6074509.1 DNA adenine methylase [Streptococcus equi subsp. zooepidemicus]HEK9955805.1 DNA adenine methylase [Streptococcus equi subsp. zooepidemicus]HEK9993454.1 DNA adenine methylase [Streptococcus equi subsp. zooepidemicus]